MASISERESKEIEAANASGTAPVVFIHGLWLLPSSWANWADFFEQAGYAPLTPDWPDDPETVDEARANPDALARKTLKEVADHTTQVINALDKKPAVIGHSTGGLLAYAATDQCARDGVGPAAVVLVDTYAAEAMHRLTVPVLDRMLEAGRAQPEMTDETLTAMVAYLGMLREWDPPAPAAPTLLVTAAQHLTGATGANGATWPHRDATVEVAADHLTILEEEADASGRAIEDWLGAPDPGARRGRLGKLLRR